MTEAKQIRSKHENSTIFQQVSRRDTESQILRVSKTYQDNDIFGYKSLNSATITNEIKQELAQKQNKLMNNSTSISPISKTKKKNDTFVPKFEDKSPKSRLFQEIYGQQYASNQECLEKKASAPKRSVTPTPKSPYERKIQEFASNIFGEEPRHSATPENHLKKSSAMLPANLTWFEKGNERRYANLLHDDKRSGIVCSFANARRKIEMHSDIFNLSKDAPERISVDPSQFSKEYTSNKQESNEEKMYMDLRKSHHTYSDIFAIKDIHQEVNNFKRHSNSKTRNEGDFDNLSYSRGGDETSPRRSISANRGSKYNIINHLEISDASFKKNTPYTLSLLDKTDRSQQNIKTEGDEEYNTICDDQSINNTLKKHCVPSVLELGNKKYDPSIAKIGKPTKNETVTFDFDLKSIPKTIDEKSLKEALIGYHIVEFKTDINRISGNILGTGRLKVKNQDMEELGKLRSKLKSMGILMLNHFEKVKRSSSNYRDTSKFTFNDENAQRQDNILPNGSTTTGQNPQKDVGIPRSKKMLTKTLNSKKSDSTQQTSNVATSLVMSSNMDRSITPNRRMVSYATSKGSPKETHGSKNSANKMNISKPDYTRPILAPKIKKLFDCPVLSDLFSFQ